MTSPSEIVTCSVLDADIDEVWKRIPTYEGINDELRPWLRMTASAEVRTGGLANVVIGERVGVPHSWVLLLGVVPIEYDDITLVRLEPGRGFLERSPMLSQRLLGARADARAKGGRCLLTDRIRFEPRLAVATPMVRRVLAATFRHRHRRLQMRFGGDAVPSAGLPQSG